MIEVKQAEYLDVTKLWKTLRKADVEEIQAASGLHPSEALLLGYEHSIECYTIWAEGERLGMFGVVLEEVNPSIGRVWLLGTDLIPTHKIEFLRKSTEFVVDFNKRFPVLFNNIDARNEVHIKWLQWLGFSFINKIENYGHEGRLFYQFVRINHV
jgi:hypothetical protein